VTEKTLLKFRRVHIRSTPRTLPSSANPILRHATYNLLYGRFSPDDRWVSSQRVLSKIARSSRSRSRCETLRSAWIRSRKKRLKTGQTGARCKTLYYTSARDGHTCLGPQRIDPGSHPGGEASRADFHGRASYQQGGCQRRGARIAVVLVEERTTSGESRYAHTETIFIGCVLAEAQRASGASSHLQKPIAQINNRETCFLPRHSRSSSPGNHPRPSQNRE